MANQFDDVFAFLEEDGMPDDFDNNIFAYLENDGMFNIFDYSLGTTLPDDGTADRADDSLGATLADHGTADRIDDSVDVLLPDGGTACRVDDSIDTLLPDGGTAGRVDDSIDTLLPGGGTVGQVDDSIDALPPDRGTESTGLDILATSSCPVTILDSALAPERIELKISPQGTERYFIPRHVAKRMVDVGVVATLDPEWCCIEAMFYLFVRWHLLDRETVESGFNDQFQPVIHHMRQTLKHYIATGTRERVRLLLLLWRTCTTIELFLQGTWHCGKIVAWFDAPHTQKMPVRVCFHSESHGGRYMLMMTAGDGGAWDAATASKELEFALALRFPDDYSHAV